MRLMDISRKLTVLITASLLLVLSPVTNAQRVDEQPSAGAMVADALVARPVYFVLSQVGSALYAVTLPFSLLGGNTDQVAENLVVTPLQGAFLRCLGCNEVDSLVGNLSEYDGSKRIQHFVALNGGVTMLRQDRSVTCDCDGFFNAGISIGTHFALSNDSRFDVLLGAKRLALTHVNLGANKYDDTTWSYELISRFGLDLGVTDLMFKMGGHYWTAHRDVKVGTQSDSYREGFGFLYGVGLDFWLTKSLRLGLEYTRYDIDIKDFGYRTDVASYDANLSFMY